MRDSLSPSGEGSMQAVVFDWDGTLVDSESLNLATWISQLAAAGYQPGRAELDRIAGRTFPDCLRYFATRVAMDVAVFERGWRAEMDRRVRADLVIFEDSVGCLKAVRAAGIPVAVATQTPRRQLDLGLARSRLAGLVIVSVCRGDVSRPKPAPDVYLEACARLGLRAQDCLAVEDSPVGARSARSAGLAVLGVARAPGCRSALASAADLVVDRLDQGLLLSMIAEPGQTRRQAPSGGSTSGARPRPPRSPR
jgi:beta-phosphoglucomutase-like phosphatase (HAD superfamily)